MKRKLITLLSAALCACFAFAGCASSYNTSGTSSSSSDSSNDNLVVATVEDKEITLGTLNNTLDYYLNYYYGISRDDESQSETVSTLREQLMNALILEQVRVVKGEQLGYYDNLTDDEISEIETYADELISSWRETFVSQAQSENSDLSEEEADKEGEKLLNEYMEENDYTRDRIIQLKKDEVVADKLYEEYTKDITVSDDDIEEEYNTRVEEDKSTFGSDMDYYATMCRYGSTIYWNPEGARKVQQILIPFTDEDQEAISNVDSSDEDALAKAVKTAQDNIQDEANSLYKELTEGKTFADALSEQENSDSTMYVVVDGIESTYDEAYVKAAMSLKKLGDVSEPIMTDSGCYILYYASDVKAGAVDLDKVKDEISESLLEDKKSEEFYNTCNSWKDEMKVETFPEVYETETAGAEASESAESEASASAEAAASVAAEASESAEASASN